MKFGKHVGRSVFPEDQSCSHPNGRAPASTKICGIYIVGLTNKFCMVIKLGVKIFARLATYADVCFFVVAYYLLPWNKQI